MHSFTDSLLGPKSTHYLDLRTIMKLCYITHVKRQIKEMHFVNTCYTSTTIDINVHLLTANMLCRFLILIT